MSGIPKEETSARPRSRYYLQKQQALAAKKRETENQEHPGKPDQGSPEAGPAPSPTTAPVHDDLSVADLPSAARHLVEELALTQETQPEPKLSTENSLEFVVSLGAVERDKLQWMEDHQEVVSVPKSKAATEKEKLFEARFDLDGTILSPDSEVHWSKGLHHHGNDPEKPGYTLEEILLLLQSTIQSQKLWALTILTAILRNAKSSLYDNHLQESLLKKVAEEGMILPLRYLLDVEALPVVTAAILALRAVLVNDADEYFTDEILLWDKEPLLFELVPEAQLDDEDREEKDIPDAELMRLDVVKGLLRTSILVRMEYLLRTYGSEMDSAVMSSAVAIVIRICRHSSEIARQVTSMQSFMELTMSVMITEKAPVAQMKLLRTLTWMLGPLANKWAEKIYHSAGGWVAELRTDITNLIIRDLVTESLNLLIVLANYGVMPRSALSVVDVFPQVLFSAGPRTGKSAVTVWDARCCSRMLVFLSLCLSIEVNKIPFLSEDALATITNNVMDAYMSLQLDHSQKTAKHMVQLEASYLMYLSEYIRFERPSGTSIRSALWNRLTESSEFLCGELFSGEDSVEITDTNPDSLPAYDLVLRGGNAVHPVFEESAYLSRTAHCARCLSKIVKEKILPDGFVRKLNHSLVEIFQYQQRSANFWAYNGVRPLLDVVCLGYEAWLSGNDIDPGSLYAAALHLIPFCTQIQQNIMETLFECIVFNPQVFKHFKWTDWKVKLFEEAFSEVAPEDMASTRAIFADLRPLGFPDPSASKCLVLPTRDGAVFTRLWMFQCFPYVSVWAKTLAEARSSSIDTYIRGYFAWLLVMVRTLLEHPDPSSTPVDVYFSLAEFFTNDEGVYRDEFVGLCLRGIMELLTVRSHEKLFLDPVHKVDGKLVDDLYNSLLDDYAASSYGDVAFTNFILIPLWQNQDLAYRRRFWGPEKQAWSVVRIRPTDPDDIWDQASLWTVYGEDLFRICHRLGVEELCYDLEHHLFPVEEDVILLNQYLKLLLSQSISESRHPLMYLVAVHHINHFLRNKFPSTEALQKFRTGLIRILADMAQVPLARTIVHYREPSSDFCRLFEVFEALPESLSSLGLTFA